MQSSFLHRLAIWKKQIKKGEPLPTGFAVPKKLYDRHQNKIKKRFKDFCEANNIALAIYSEPTNNRKLF